MLELVCYLAAFILWTIAAANVSTRVNLVARRSGRRHRADIVARHPDGELSGEMPDRSYATCGYAASVPTGS